MSIKRNVQTIQLGILGISD